MNKVSIFLPPNSGNSVRRSAQNIAKSLAYQSIVNSDNIQVIFSYPKDEFYNPLDFFEDLVQYNIVLRETSWEIHSRESLDALKKIIGKNKMHLSFASFCLPSDNINNFYDCALWIVVSDNLPAPLLQLRTTIIILDEYNYRYASHFPKNSTDTLINKTHFLRQASKIITNNPSVTTNLITHAGVNKSRIKMLPVGFQPTKLIETTLKIPLPSNYILWPIDNLNNHNYMNAILAYETYVKELDGSLHLIISIQNSKIDINPNTYPDSQQSIGIQNCQDKINRDPVLKKQIFFVEQNSESINRMLIKNAKFLWSTLLQANSTHTIMDSAYLGTPILSSRTPYTEYINETYKTNLQFFDSKSYKSIAKALLNMENICSSIILPDWTTLNYYNWQFLSHFIYREIIDFII